VAVEFTGLLVNPYVNSSTNRLAYSVKATGVRAAGPPSAPGMPGSPARHSGAGRPGAEGKEAAA
jgi:hypothetical protein